MLYRVFVSRMHSGDLSELNATNLTGMEREALLQVMQRAKVSLSGKEGRTKRL